MCDFIVPIIDGAVIRAPKMRIPSEEVGLPLVQELHHRHVPFRAREPERRRARLRDLVTPATPTLDPLRPPILKKLWRAHSRLYRQLRILQHFLISTR